LKKKKRVTFLLSKLKRQVVDYLNKSMLGMTWFGGR